MDHQAIRDKGWLQGSIIAGADHGELNGHLPGYIQIESDDCIIVASHSCDVLNRSEEKEPHVEVCVGKPCSNDNAKRNGKNSRFLQLPVVNDGSTHYFEIHAKDRFALPRSLLADLSPDTDRQLDADNIEILRCWLAARFVRSAFPDAFNERTGAAFKNIRNKAKKISLLTSAVFIALDPQEEELPDDESYTVNIIGAIPDTVLDAEPDARQKVDDFMSALAAQLKKCEGIKVNNHDAKFESEITMQDLRYLRELDYDDLSFKEGDPRAP